MPDFKRLYIAIEEVEILINGPEDDVNITTLVTHPPDKVDSHSDNENIRT